MIFDTTVSVSAIEVIPGEDHIQLGLGIIAYLPTPQGNLPVPLGMVRVPMTKETALAKAQEIIEAAGQVPDEKAAEPAQKKSDIIIAQNLNGVEQVDKMDKSLRTKK